jgi:hypothetical protein
MNHEGETNMRKQNLSLMLALVGLFILMAAQTNAGTLDVTTGLYSETEDLTARVQSEFGSNWSIADWTYHIRDLYDTNPTGFSNLLDKIGSTHIAWVTNIGERFWPGNPLGRHYFVQLFPNGQIPGYFLAHDSLTFGGKVLALGSWLGMQGHVVAYCQQVVPEPCSMIALLGGLGSLLAFRRRTARL